MRPSPLLSAAAAASLLAALAGPATAATAPSPAAGIASSTVTLLDVAAGGRTLSAGSLSLLSDALGADAVAKILVTPLTIDGKTYGQRTITPAESPATVTSLDSGSVAPALAGLVKIASPVLTATAANDASGPSSRAGADSFGGLSVLGLPIAVDGTLDVGSIVSRTAGATGSKTLEVTDLALPSIADLLAALGLDLTKLPTDVLVELLTKLDLLTPAVTAANAALSTAMAAIQTQVDAAQAAVDKATTDLAAKTAELAGATSQLTAKQSELTAATAALAPLQAVVGSAQAQQTAAQSAVTSAQTAVDAVNAAIATATLGGTLPVPPALASQLTAATSTLTAAQATLTSATAAVTAATTALSTAQSAADVIAAAVTALQATVATLQGVVNTLQATLNAALAALQGVLKDVLPLINTLIAAVTTVLDGTPLVSIDSLKVITESTVTSAVAGGQTAKVTGGEVTGLHVLGTDVLDNVLGNTSVDLLGLTGAKLADVNGLLGTLTGTLSNVLSTVPGFPALSIPAPKVELLTKSADTGILNGFGTATTAVRALSITLPAITLPQALALPSAASLPAFGSALPAARSSQALLDGAGNLVSSPITIALGTLSEQARFKAAAAGTPTTVTPDTATPDEGAPTVTPVGTDLPRTGASSALAALGVVLMSAAVATRRRRSADALEA